MPSKLGNLLFGTPEERARKKALTKQRKEVYQQAYERGTIARAKREGYRAGSKPQKGRLASTMDALTAISKTSNQAADFLMGDMSGWGLGSQRQPRKKAHSRKSKKGGKTITIHVK